MDNSSGHTKNFFLKNDEKKFAFQSLGKHRNKGLIITPNTENLSGKKFLADNLEDINRLLIEHGAILLRGFRILGAQGFREVVEAMHENILEYKNRSTPRKIISEGVFSSTEYPQDQSIPQHNEMSYTLSWPKKIFFYCNTPPSEGGQTPIADSRCVYKKLPKELKERFEKHGIMYVRNFGNGIDLTWQDAFQTNKKEEVEEYCNEHEIEFQWLDNEHLRTKQICQASITDKSTEEKSWFNQAHLFHISNLPSDIENYLRRQYSEEELPRNALLGDGNYITKEDLKIIRDVYKDEEILFDWEKDDILILDNERISHGRRPFNGERSIMVSMT